MVYRTVVAAATVFVGVGILCGCREESMPRRPVPQTQTPGPGTDGGLLPGPDPAGSGETDGPTDGSADRSGEG